MLAPKIFWQDCCLGWQLCHLPIKTESEQFLFHPIVIIIRLVLIIVLKSWPTSQSVSILLLPLDSVSRESKFRVITSKERWNPFLSGAHCFPINSHSSRNKSRFSFLAVQQKMTLKSFWTDKRTCLFKSLFSYSLLIWACFASDSIAKLLPFLEIASSFSF